MNSFASSVPRETAAQPCTVFDRDVAKLDALLFNSARAYELIDAIAAQTVTSNGVPKIPPHKPPPTAPSAPKIPSTPRTPSTPSALSAPSNNKLSTVLASLQNEAKKHFKCKVYLYGSRVYGTAVADSDINAFFDVGKSHLKDWKTFVHIFWARFQTKRTTNLL